MKRLHWLILKTFIGPLFFTFFVVVFMLIMQFLWLYIDDMVGKGLDYDIIIELIVYAIAGLVPMALPLSILLASLMTMGNFGENNELIAIKSAGISLTRFAQPLFLLVLTLTIGAILYSNYILPSANLKKGVVLYDVRHKRPDLQIKVGVFNNEIDNYRIKVASINHRTGMMYNLLIYDHQSNQGNVHVTIADSGFIRVTSDKRYMIATLYNGINYEDIPENIDSRSKGLPLFPARKTSFTEQQMMIELKGFEMKRSNIQKFNSLQALNINELLLVSDSLDKKNILRKKDLENMIYNIFSKGKINEKKPSEFNVSIEKIIGSLNISDKKMIYASAIATAKETKNTISLKDREVTIHSKIITWHKIELNKRYTLSLACMLFFLIGASLGAIIRKGGLGLPMVVSVLFFVVYYFISFVGDKLARELIWSAFMGTWFSTFILLPLGIFLSYKSVTDSEILKTDFYTHFFRKMRLKIKK